METVVKKVSELVKEGVLFPPMDGNHGEKHPKTSDYVESGVPFIIVPDLKDGLVDLKNCSFITPKQASTLSKGISITGDVLFTHKATIGRTAIVDTLDHDYIILTPQVTYYRIRNNKVLYNKFLYYYFNTSFFQNTFKLYASSGGTRDYLGITAQLKLPIVFPEIGIQKKIASVLSKYDELIHNNNARIKLLETFAEDLFKEWFVRFRNPLNIRNAFGKVGDICTIKSGFAYKSSDWQQEGIPVVKIKDIIDGYVNTDELDAVPVEIAAKAKNFNLMKMDLVIAMTGATIGKVGIVYKDGLSTNQRVGKIFANKNYGNITPFLFCFFRQQNIVETVLMYSGASSAQPNISGEMLQKINMPFNEQLIKLFNDKCEPLFKEIITLKNKNDILIKQRDSLLPKLLSGKLSVEGKEIV